MQGHILIVEDEEAIAAFLQTALEQEGFTTQWVSNGAAALSAIDTARPDLILLDLMLPGMDGLQVSVDPIFKSAALPARQSDGRSHTVAPGPAG
jgi:two-component system, OmpR family, response regulator MtrA